MIELGLPDHVLQVLNPRERKILSNLLTVIGHPFIESSPRRKQALEAMDVKVQLEAIHQLNRLLPRFLLEWIAQGVERCTGKREIKEEEQDVMDAI